jgi:hypothetical protein
VKTKLIVSIIILSALLITATAAFAAVTFNAATGTGFVGKGDVQLALGWNNKQLQDNAGSVQFQAVSEVVTGYSWECQNNNNQKINERNQTTTITIEGVVSHILRERNQITGFILDGYSEKTELIVKDGPELNTCQNQWTLIEDSLVSDDPVIEGGLQVGFEDTWYDLE